MAEPSQDGNDILSYLEHKSQSKNNNPEENMQLRLNFRDFYMATLEKTYKRQIAAMYATTKKQDKTQAFVDTFALGVSLYDDTDKQLMLLTNEKEITKPVI